MTTPQNMLYVLSDRIKNLTDLFTDGSEDKNCLFDRIKEVEEKIDSFQDMIESMIWKFERLNESLHAIISMEQFLEKISLMETQMNDRQEKLQDNTKRVNEMTLELKGVVAQARSCVNATKDFVKKRDDEG